MSNTKILLIIVSVVVVGYLVWYFVMREENKKPKTLAEWIAQNGNIKIDEKVYAKS